MQAQGPFLGCCGGFFFISKRALLDYPTLIYSCTASTVRYVSLGTPQPAAAAAQVGCVAPASQRPQRLPHSCCEWLAPAIGLGGRGDGDAALQTDTLGLSTTYTAAPSWRLLSPQRADADAREAPCPSRPLQTIAAPPRPRQVVFISPLRLPQRRDAC
jgi:hypothetical protein